MSLNRDLENEESDDEEEEDKRYRVDESDSDSETSDMLGFENSKEKDNHLNQGYARATREDYGVHNS